MTVRYLFPVLGLLLATTILSAQPARISGVINSYAPVLRQDYCSNSIVIDSAGDFSAGDRVLLIQIRGAAFDSTDTPRFGAILDYGSAGLYEMGTIEQIDVISPDSTAIVFRNNILNQYDPRGRVQLVRVPQYTDVIVEGTLTAPRWDDTVGGIIALEASGTIRLEADIDASGIGFLGGWMYDQGPINCSVDGYRMRAFGGNGALKGEGIAEFPDTSFMGGRGALTNGGGGGNSHNSGGGGGGNAGAGGQGGWQWEGCGAEDLGGLGGRPLDYGSGRIFLGGGAGAGHTNNSDATDSGHGGGIVILRAAALDGRAHTITAAGLASHGPLGVANQDASSGGGAGGVIIADVERYLSEVFYRAGGGKGGDNNSSDAACHGTGGGGGGGVIDLSNPAIPSGVTVDVAGGRSGVGLNPRSKCYNTSWGAADGSAGIVRTGTRAAESAILFEPSSGTFTLPLITAAPGDTVIFNLTLSENTNLAFSGATRYTATIRVDGSVVYPLAPGATRLPNGDIEFTLSGTISDTGSTPASFPFLALLGTRSAAPVVIETFAWDDSTELMCPLFVTRRDGELLLTVCQEGGERLVATDNPVALRAVAPNPAYGAITIEYDLLEDGPIEIYLVDRSGRRIRTLVETTALHGRHSVSTELDDVASGEYLVVLKTATQVVSGSFRVVR